MCGYYRNFVKNYSTVASPLTDLTRLDTPWDWNDECEAAFKRLKHALVNHEVLMVPDPQKPFIVTTDASQYGIGAVLAQQHGKKLRPIEYMSKALVHWRHFLLGRFFYLRIDHQTLKWIKTQPALFDALKRWIEVIDQYDFKLEYLKGEYNKVADALSRRADYLGALVCEFGVSEEVTQLLVRAYQEDPITMDIIRKLQAKDKATEDEFVMVDGLLFLRKAGTERLVVPSSENLRSLFLASDAEKPHLQALLDGAIKREQESEKERKETLLSRQVALLETVPSLTEQQCGEHMQSILTAFVQVRNLEDHTTQIAEVFAKLQTLQDDLIDMTRKYHDLIKEVADLRQAQVANPRPLPPGSEAAIETTSAPLTVSSSTSSSSVMATPSGPATGADSTVAVTNNEAGTSAIVAAPRPEPAAAGPSYTSPYVYRKAIQMPSKCDSKDDIESWIGSMRAYFEILGTQPENKAVIMGMNVEPIVRGFLEVQATRAGFPKAALAKWLRTTPVASLEELLISEYQDPYVAAQARIQLDKVKHNKWNSSMKSLQTYLSKLFATPGLELSTQSCLDVVKGAVPTNFTSRLGRDYIAYTDWLALMKDVVSLEANLVSPTGSKKPMGGRRFKGSNRFVVDDLLEAEEEADAGDPTLGDDQEQDSDTPYIQTLLDRFPEVLAEPRGVPTRPVRHTIELVEGAVPPKGCVYRMGPGELEELRGHIDEMIDEGWIKPSEFEFGAPILFVPKKGVKLRMCIDYRGLNRITRKNAYPLPRIDDLLDAAGGCKAFSKIDLKSGYHQIEVDPADQHKTAFKTRDGLYDFTVMPFGLTNAPATFQSLMDKVLDEQIGRFVGVYLDDILIFSKSMEEHLKHLEEVLAILKKTQLHLNLEKSEFGKDSVIYLGHRLSVAGLELEATKIEVIRDWPQPANIRELRSFLGLASYYRKFVPRFSIIARPLSRLTNKNVSYSWDAACTEVFQALKEALASYPVLRIADPKLTFVVTTDASRYGIGAVLQQDDGDGLRPLEYYSKRKPSIKVATSTYMRELHALCMALDHLKHYLLGRHFKVFSDHETLKQKPMGLLTPLPIPNGPGENVSIDFTDMGKESKHGYSQVMVIVDRFLKFLNLIPLLPHAPTDLVIREFQQKYLLQFETPKTLVSDPDPHFNSTEWKDFTPHLEIKLCITSGRHPEANGLAEEINQTVFQLLRALIIPDQETWDEELYSVKGLYNNSVHSATATTPNRLHYGWQIRNPLSYLFPEQSAGSTPGRPDFRAKYDRLLKVVVGAMTKRQHAMIHHANKKRRPSEIQVGSYVWVKMSEFSEEEGVSRKLLPLYYGPWEVLDVIGEDHFGPSYVADVPAHLCTYPVFHASKLYLHCDAETFDYREDTIPCAIKGTHEIDRIKQHGGKGRNKQYQVHFMYHPLDDLYWISKQELLRSAPRVVKAYGRQIAADATPKI
ncbi:hypothetical protein CBR_g49224 [Chara braunii]|uniref:Integrase catalytic domain-containing protein n=1 Tax=Chara braunii TaxID=69332 RepID=A0A388M4M6_CHABU|nr:hypothetical protein CBR_g49224 [Chara braunii]|eukprot:GBG89433.1 hypothetical protein CBR_g49224 [Chara braunii]